MQTTVRLTARQESLLRLAAGNGGIIHTGDRADPAERKAVKALVRCGVLSPGSGIRGYGARHITAHGRRVFTALNLTPIDLPEED